jgi:hypothetical protein
LGERATVEWPQRRFFTFARPDEAASNGSVKISSPTQIQERCAGEISDPTTRRRAMVGFYPRSPQIHDGDCEEIQVKKNPTPPSPFLSFFFFYPGHG